MGPKNVPTSIEKNNLETHVILCSERYDNISTSVKDLENKIDDVEEHLLEKIESHTEKIEEKFNNYSNKIDTAIEEIKQSIAGDKEKHNEMLLKWAVAIIGTLITIIGSLLFKIMPFIESVMKLNNK